MTDYNDDMEQPPCWDKWGYSFNEHDFDRTDKCVRCGQEVQYT